MVNAGQMIDTGFVLFVTFTCGYALFGNKDKSETRTRRWAMELAALQETLRELIGEATAAGSNLDRTLLKRKQEIEGVLQRLEATTNSGEQLPNASWERRAAEAPRPTRAAVKNQEQQRRAAAARPEPEKRKEEPPVQRPAKPPIEPGSLQDSQLARRIEIFLDEQPARRASMGDPTDPAAYKVARRLLEGGKEIHVVARKVGLPIEEVRMIDSMVQRDAAMLPDVTLREEVAEEAAPAVAPATYSRAKRVAQTAQRDQWTDELAGLLEDSELEIRRETTFL